MSSGEKKYQRAFEKQTITRSMNKHGLSFIDKYQTQLNHLLESEPFLKSLDKVTFACGVLVLLLTQHILSARPTFMPYYYLILILPLLCARYFIYTKNGWQYFMIDFCYFCQIMTIISIFTMKTEYVSPFLQVAYVFSHGPLLMAIPMWKNSLVFHDLDRLTSVYIHLFPALVMYCIRWHTYITVPELTLFNGLILPAILYIFWQIVYLIITEGFKKETIKKNGYITSLIWLSQEHPHPIYLYLVKKGVKDRPLVILVSVQFVYTILTIVPAFLYYKYQYLNLAWIILCTSWAIANGANFYFEVFIKQYEKRVDNSVKKLKKTEAPNVISPAPSATEAADTDSGTETE
ncbi:hypothetical protein EIN_409170 [Entamoeba invadens IP1]|uniref:Glycerophosphocholine acyltransferase 1 n=2 Tax=Entamoeba invadens TaxID=33085 RepID=A0A0A1U289_ENTIV|nr:hypothetical protein EIN_409170 [Entamoeba invadens IP1]ELP85628.1 hypothetical protein EIN_409170 [Entamoeba invadens IP1]BAN40674.1 hypothetical protein, conserved [Entamoeba invadens]|eukprot:XP_004184974.1 hypothetical protein EIN_409170 [Entamoeba invadens IP1]